MDDLSKFAPFAVLGDVDSHSQDLAPGQPEQANTLLLLYEVSRELTSILDREELLRRIAERVKKLVNFHVFTVMLWNEKTQFLEGVFAMHYDNSIPSRFRVPLSQGITGAAAAERRTIRIDDVRDDPRYIQSQDGVDVRSELVVPLLLQDRLIGVLDLESTEPRAFRSGHEGMLATLGSYIAIALENARLYESARENERRLQLDLETAREIQQQLLPRGAKEIPGLEVAAGYVPARELGGDFYDFLPYGEGRLAIVLGDVSGKGTAAALYGSLAIGTLREIVVDHRGGPAEMLRTLNRRLLGARLDARFIALHFAIYDAAARQLTIANAGGPYPLLVRGGTASEIRVEGVPLGLLPGIEYEETTIELQPGDLVIFASDGIQESEDDNQEEFGTVRLAELLARVAPQDSAREVAELVLSATDNYSGLGVPPHDDRTLLVLRALDEPVSADFSKLPIIY